MMPFGRGDESNSEVQGVFANAISAAMQAAIQKDKTELISILIFNIRYAYTVVMEMEGKELPDIIKELDAMRLEKLHWEELLVWATFYQAQAGIRPVQQHRASATTFRRVTRVLMK